MTCFLVRWLPFLIVAGLAAHADAAAGNLLRNPDFQIKSGRSIAKHWHDNSGWADVDVSYDKALDGDDRWVQKIRCTRYKSGAVQFIQRGLPVKKQKAYRISARIKGDVETPVEIILRKRHKPYTIYLRKAFTVTGTWQDISHTGISVHDDANAVFQVRFADTGTLFIYRAGLLDITDRSAAGPVKTGNLLSNSSFEVGLDRWGVKFRETGGYANALSLEYADPKPEIAQKGAVHGNWFLKLALPDHSRVKVTSAYVRVRPNRSYTVSCWMAASPRREVTFGLASGYLGKGFKPVRTVTVGSHWRRYTFSTPLKPSADNAYYFSMETSGKGRVFLDGVSLKQGSGSGYEPSAPAEVGFLRARSRPIAYQGSKITWSLRCANHTTADTTGVTISAVDFRGNETEIDQFRVQAGAAVTRTFELPTGRTGYWKLRAAARIKNTEVDAAERAVAVVPRPVNVRTADSAFGGHVRFNPESLAYAKMLGVKWLRTHPPDATKWFIVEKEKGDFVYFDAPFKLAREKGFHILGMLATTPRWASSAPADERAEHVGGFRSYPAKDLRDWRRYVHRTVSFFKGVIDHWEIWNEPDTRFFKLPAKHVFSASKPRVYGDMVKAARRTAKTANPAAVLIGGGAVQVPLADWTEAVAGTGALAQLDILSYHQYFTKRPGLRLAKSIASEVAEFRQVMRRHASGSARPIWNTEGGILFTETNYRNIHEVVDEYALDPARGPSYLVRNYVRLLGSGVEKLFFYHLFTSHQADRREGTGFFEWDGSPRPLAAAYAVLAKNIDGCRFVAYQTDGPKRVHAVFTNRTKRVSIIWQAGQQETTGSTFAVKKQPGVTFLGLMGNNLVPQERNGRCIIRLSPDPVYLIEPL